MTAVHVGLAAATALDLVKEPDATERTAAAPGLSTRAAPVSTCSGVILRA